MIDAVDQHLEERAALERGFGATLVLSTAGHVLTLLALGLASWLGRTPPRLNAMTGIAVPMPAGGGGPLNLEPAPPAPVPPPPKPTQSAAPPEPEPPKVIKPPKEEKKGLPPLEEKRPTKKAAPTPPPRPSSAARGKASPAPTRAAVGSQPGGTGANPATPGLGIIGPAGPGVPGGTDPQGDFYLAGVQRKIWLIWMRQVKPGFAQPVVVSMTINADGSLVEGSVRTLQSGGSTVLDLAAQRSVYTAAPFAPLPRTYGTNRITIQVVFQPTP